MIQREKGNFSEYYDLREQNNDPRAMDTIIFTSSLLSWRRHFPSTFRDHGTEVRLAAACS